MSVDKERKFFFSAAPFQPPTEEWERIMKEIITQCDKVENDFVSICQGQKVCVSMKYSVMRIY